MMPMLARDDNRAQWSLTGDAVLGHGAREDRDVRHRLRAFFISRISLRRFA
jgi:hypothetical protein